MCQINTDPMKSQQGYLQVVGKWIEKRKDNSTVKSYYIFKIITIPAKSFERFCTVVLIEANRTLESSLTNVIKT